MSTAAPFSLDPTLRTLSTAALLKRYKRLSPAERQTLGFTRPATDAEVATATQTPGAPADFGGPVFPNPNGVKVSADTESGIEPLRLPNGVTLQHQNFTGRMPADASTPPQAQIVGPHLQTISSTSSPVKLDMSTAQPIPAAAPVKLDMSTAQPIGASGEPPADYLTRAEDRIHEVAATAARAVGSAWDTITGIPGAVYHAAADPPTPEELKSLGLGKSTGPGRVANFIQRMIGGGQLSEAARFYKQYYDATPDQRRDMETEMLSVAPEAIGAGAGAALLPKIVEKIPGTVGAVADLPAKLANSKPTLTAPVRLGARAAETAINQKLLPVKKLVNLMTPADEAEALHVKVPGRDYGLEPKPVYPGADLPADPGTFPGADLPEVPSREALQARALENPGAAPAEEPSAALGRIPGRKTPVAQPEATAPAVAATPETSTPHGGGIPRTLSGESALRQILTGQDNANLIKIAKSRGINITQESQLKAGVADSKLINKIIDHFSDDELDGVRSQYLENNRMGKHNFGDIGPEAWKTMGMQSYFPDVKIPEASLRRTQTAIASAEKAKSAPAGTPSPLQQKVSNLEDFIRPAPGKGAAKPAATEPARAAKPAEEPDLVDQLQKSVDLAKPGDVFTHSDPELLMKRWGVDEASLKTGREQTRGMKPEQTEAQIERLSEAYKEGKPVEPIMETRGADNRLVDADGRMRVVAAHRAGLKRIPIIVRKLQPIE